MTIIWVVSIKNIISSSSESLDGDGVKHFFSDEISKIIVDHVLIDFSEVKSLNDSFASQYLSSKDEFKGKKVIREINISENICKVFQTAQKEIEKSNRKK